jgi:hypothetical protein
MLHDTALLRRLVLQASDGDIGSLDDTYFSDDSWTIRYLVVDTGEWLTGRKVLVSPRAVSAIDYEKEVLQLALTREQVRGSPDYDRHKPVSRQYETEYAQYYGYSPYWSGPYLWGISEYPSAIGTPIVTQMEPSPAMKERAERERARADPHLRSTHEVSGYTLAATDGDIGHIKTFLFDEQRWSIDALVVDTRNWLPGRHVVIPPRWIEEIDWSAAKARLSVTRERIRTSAEYEPEEGHGRAHKAARIVRTLLMGKD